GMQWLAFADLTIHPVRMTIYISAEKYLLAGASFDFPLNGIALLLRQDWRTFGNHNHIGPFGFAAPFPEPAHRYKPVSRVQPAVLREHNIGPGHYLAMLIAIIKQDKLKTRILTHHLWNGETAAFCHYHRDMGKLAFELQW